MSQTTIENKRKVHFISLGCPKNLVDSEIMAGTLMKDGYEVVGDENEAETVVVNTCGFIEDSKAESIQRILDMAELKKSGQLKRLVVAGCLTQRYKDELVEGLPEADLFVYLDEVNSAGKSQVISFGRLKLSHRKLSQAPYVTLGLPWHSGLAKDMLPLAPGEQAPVSLALTPLSRVVPAGSKLRLTIAGADPRQRNLNDIKITPAPVIGVVRGGRDPSRIELPLAR